ncbi:hypothetical protein E2C01_007472 [Portunus trituberculatus]|uniref:Uncharacterized protein n=1 Tax=Portunus trituberculatus TaxID=210409 RepID=A0A5B7D0K7_PORTR|nr:hypothetical protein [Portunus trituberculatus]
MYSSSSPMAEKEEIMEVTLAEVISTLVSIFGTTFSDSVGGGGHTIDSFPGVGLTSTSSLRMGSGGGAWGSLGAPTTEGSWAGAFWIFNGEAVISELDNHHSIPSIATHPPNNELIHNRSYLMGVQQASQCYSPSSM